jgi:hypothetical protein
MKRFKIFEKINKFPFSQLDKGPKDVKLFINQTRSLDFDSAESNTPIQAFE